MRVIASLVIPKVKLMHFSLESIEVETNIAYHAIRAILCPRERLFHNAAYLRFPWSGWKKVFKSFSKFR